MKIQINEIIIGERRRQDMGDINGLAESIRNYGLLHPIVIDENNVLVAGGRRLEAVKRLGWTNVPVTLLQELTEKELRAIELEENIRRKDLTEIEKSRNMDSLIQLKAAEIAESKPDETFSAEQKNQVIGRPPTLQVPMREIAKATGIPEKTLHEARQHVAAVDKYPELESLPKKQAIQTARELDKLPLSPEYESRRAELDEQIRRDTTRQNTDKAFSMIYDRVIYLSTDYANIAQCLLENPNRTREDTVQKLSECVERLQQIKIAILKTSSLRTVK